MAGAAAAAAPIDLAAAQDEEPDPAGGCYWFGILPAAFFREGPIFADGPIASMSGYTGNSDRALTAPVAARPPRRGRFFSALKGVPSEGTPEFPFSHYREDGLRPNIREVFCVL